MYRIFQTTELISFHFTIAVELPAVCHGKPQNFRKCRAEWTEFFHGKLWSLLIISFAAGVNENYSLRAVARLWLAVMAQPKST